MASKTTFEIFGNNEKSYQKKDSEDIFLLKILDDIFVNKRGYTVKIPKKKEAVVACLSGGLDSVANIGILLKELKLNVYPFFINRGQSNYKWEKAAVKYFDSFYKKRFPDQYHTCMEINVATPAKEYKNLLRKVKKSANCIPKLRNIAYPARNPIIFLTGAEYAYSLKARGENITTIFASNVSSDKSLHCSQTWIRLMNLLMCQILNNWKFQFISLPIETSFGNYFDKDVYAYFMAKNNIPVEKTRSCVRKSKMRCGDCPPCWNRRKALETIGIKDKTQYIFKMSPTCPTYYSHE